MFVHPRREEIDRFQAKRISCDVDAIRSGGTSIVTEDREPSSLGIFEAPEGTIVAVDRSPSPAVVRIVGRIPDRERISPDFLIGLGNAKVTQCGTRDLTYYLDPKRFRPTMVDGIRPLADRDSSLLAVLQDAVEQHQRWYVEIGHAGLFACLRDGAVTAAASHMLESGHAITDLGVLTHPAHRRMGHGRAVVSASIRWGMERDLICQWVTTDRNVASLALARAVGFDYYGTETELCCS
jgi:GNAT superfamily N-acetyltransferase